MLNTPSGHQAPGGEMQSSGGQSVQQGNGRRVAGFFRLQRLFGLRLATQLRHLIGERKKKGIEAAGGSTKAASVFTRAAPTPRTPHPHPSPHPTFTHTHGPLSAALTLSLYFSLFLLGLLNSPLLLLSSKKIPSFTNVNLDPFQSSFCPNSHHPIVSILPPLA